MTNPSDIHFDATPVHRTAWERLCAGAGRTSLEQSHAYGEAVAACHDYAIERGVVRAGDQAVAMVQTVRVPILGMARVARILRGPIWLAGEFEPALVAAVLRTIRARVRLRRREILLWLPEFAGTPENHAMMRAAGLRRMVTGYSTAWLDLTADAEALRAGLDGKWRNMLTAGEATGLKVRRADDGRALEALLALYDRFRGERRFVGPPGKLVRAIHAAGKRGETLIGLTAAAAGEAVAGIALVRHGASATYYVGWSGPEGRRRRAHNLLLWRGILAAKEAGVRWLDLGGIDAVRAPGVARFKLGVGGELVTLAGTYL